MTTVLKLDEKHYRSPAPMPAKPLIELRGVTKSYRSAQGMMQALRPLDFEIREQEFVSIVRDVSNCMRGFSSDRTARVA